MSFSTACELDSAQKPHRKLKSSLRDPLLSTKPIDTRPTGLVFQQNFGNYLDGQLNANKLIQKLNYPRQNYQKPLVTSKFDPFAKIKLKTEQRKKYLQSKISKVQALIQQKVVLKKTENTQIRQENSQNLVFVQCIIDIAKQSINDSKSPTRMTPKSKCLKGCRLNYDNVKPTCQFLKEKQYTDIQRPYLKTALESNTQLYMEELETQNLQRENYLNRQVKLSIQQRKSDFKLFHTAAKTDRKNQDGILTYADVQLYDYLYNKPKSITITNHPKYIQNVIDSDTQLRRQTQPSPTPKRYVHYNQEFPDADSVSYTSSLQSAGEIKLDKYYSESMQLKKTEQSQLCKRIKQLMRLEDLNQKAIHTTLNKIQ